MQQGRDPKKLCAQPCKGFLPQHSEQQLWPEKIVEYDPAADAFVWEWNVWDWKNPYYALRPTSPRNSGAGFPIRQNWFSQVDKYGKDFPAFAGKEAQLTPPTAPPADDEKKDEKKDD